VPPPKKKTTLAFCRTYARSLLNNPLRSWKHFWPIVPKKIYILEDDVFLTPSTLLRTLIHSASHRLSSRDNIIFPCERSLHSENQDLIAGLQCPRESRNIMHSTRDICPRSFYIAKGRHSVGPGDPNLEVFRGRRYSPKIPPPKQQFPSASSTWRRRRPLDFPGWRYTTGATYTGCFDSTTGYQATRKKGRERKEA